jgi:hypothetical protein
MPAAAGSRWVLVRARDLTPSAEAQLKKMGSILNDVHKPIVAVSKALRKPAA